jgi:hypothetical protein
MTINRKLAPPWDNVDTTAIRDLVLPWDNNRKRGRLMQPPRHEPPSTLRSDGGMHFTQDILTLNRNLAPPWDQVREEARFPELVFWVPRTEGY